ncbi:MAG: MerC domain-containing protein [Myxococcota bacterium]
MSESARVSTRPLADLVGIVGSTLCALHCLIVPISLVVGPIGLLSAVQDEFFHRALLFIVVPAAALAFTTGCLQHRDRRVFFLGVGGLLLLTASLTVLHDWIGENGERIAALTAAALLITAHVRNFRLCRSDDCEHAEPERA